jgi:heme/copper-type cytochrome/quinol oxidase subunit 3
MTTRHHTHHTPKKFTAILAIIFLIPALYIFGIWLNVYQDPDASQTEKVSGFLRHFPSGLNINIINSVSIGFCLAAVIFAAISFKQRLLSLRIIMMLTVLAASLIILLDIFQIM